MLFTLLFGIYLGFILSYTVDAILGSNEDIPKSLNVIVDWIYLTMFPSFGLVMNKSAWGMWRDDHYSRRLAHWRTMPIPISSIVKARMAQSGLMIPIIGGIYLLLQYAASQNLRDTLTPMQMVQFGLIWLCFALVINAVYIWAELSLSGKGYCFFYLGYFVLVTVLSTLIVWQEIYVFQEVLEIIRSGRGGGWIAGLAALAAAALWIGYRATVKRIRSRSLPLG
jgi:hypothetical protein